MTEDDREYRLLTLGRMALVRTGASETAALVDAKPLAVLAVLAVEGSQRPEQITELVWPDVPWERAAASLRQALYTLSQVAGTPLVERCDGRLCLDPDRLTVDFVEFREAMEGGDHEDAIRVYGGHFLGGYEALQDRRFVQWAEEVDDWVEVQLQQAYDHAVEAALRTGDVERAVTLAEAFRDRFPLVTQAVDCLVIALRAAGRLRVAMAEIHLFEQRLGQELDEPLPAELADYREVLEAELRESLNGLGEEVGEPEPVREAAPESAITRERRWRAGLIGTAAVAVAAVGLAMAADGDRFELTIPALMEGGLGQVVLNRDGVRAELLIAGRRQRSRSPTGVMAEGIVTPRGVDIELESPDGNRRVILDERADEVPMDWSPDGRYLLYRHVQATAQAPGFRERVRVWDSRTGESRILFEAADANVGREGAWCTSGGRVALEEHGAAGERAIVVVDLAGSVLSRMGGGNLKLEQPAWSPDGNRLAISGTRDGETDIYVAQWDGSNLRRLGAAPATERHPVWLSSEHIAAVTEGPGRRFVILSTEGSEALSLPLPRRLRLVAAQMDTWPANGEERVSELVRQLEGWQEAAAPAVWLDSVVIEGSPVLSPGEWATYRLTGKDGRGRRSAMLPPALAWAVRDSSILQPLDGGAFRALRSGTTRIKAALPGWPDDMLTVTVREPGVRDVPVLFSEDWTAGLDPQRWLPYGDPLPHVELVGGPEGGGTFDNMGDANLNSGAVTRRSFPLTNGLTVEFWGRMVPTGDAFQGFSAALVTGDPTVLRATGLPQVDAVAGFGVEGTHRSVALQRRPATRVPAPVAVEEWQRYALQLHLDGTLALLVNGRVYVRDVSPPPNASSVHVELMGRSLTTTVLYGPLVVYGGLRYDIE